MSHRSCIDCNPPQTPHCVQKPPNLDLVTNQCYLSVSLLYGLMLVVQLFSIIIIFLILFLHWLESPLVLVDLLFLKNEPVSLIFHFTKVLPSQTHICLFVILNGLQPLFKMGFCFLFKWCSQPLLSSVVSPVSTRYKLTNHAIVGFNWL